MADPFSVASAAAGVISLGLTVCQGLVAYFGPFSAYDSEIKSLVLRVEGLASTIEALNGRLSSLEPSQCTTELHEVTDRINDCGEGLRNLSKVLDKCKSQAPSAMLKEKGRYLTSKAQYPFKRDTLHYLVNNVAGLQSNLDTALELLHLTLTQQIQEQTSLTLSVSHSIAASTSNISTNTSEILQKQERMEQMLQLLLVSHQSQNRTVRREASLPPPSLLESLCDEQKGINRQLMNEGVHAERNVNLKRCTCPPSQRGPFFRWNIFQTTNWHKFDCPLYFEKETIPLLRKRVVACNRFLNFAFNLHLNTIRGAGGFTVHPIFSIRSIVPEDAPAFKIVEQGLERSWNSTDVPRVFDDMRTQLQRLFENGKASPLDRLPDGSTLLHAVAGSMDLVPLAYSPQLRDFIRTLVVTFHVPVNEEGGFWGSRRPATMLSLLIGNRRSILVVGQDTRSFRNSLRVYISHLTDIISDLASLNAICAPPLALGDCHIVVASTRRLVPETALNSLIIPNLPHDLVTQELSLTGLDTAVLGQSKTELEEALCQLSDKNITEEAFMASLGWPEGLQMILPRVHDDKWLSKALNQSIAFQRAQAVEILLHDGRCPIFGEALWIGARRLCHNPTIFKTIVSCLSDRRKSLLTAARLHLPQKILEQLNIAPALCIPDQQAGKLYEALQKHLGKVDSKIIAADHEYDGFSVYKYVHCNLHAADILFNAGFTDIDNSNLNGWSLFLDIHAPENGRPYDILKDCLNMCKWVNDRGASLYIKPPGTNLYPLRHIAHQIGQVIQSRRWIKYGNSGSTIFPPFRVLEKLFLGHEWLLRPILMDGDNQDSCSCPCSKAGCCASTILANRISAHAPWQPQGLHQNHILADFIGIKWSKDTAVVQEIHGALAPVAIRVCTFGQLQLKHTCCTYTEFWGKDQLDDIPEIQAEQQPLVDHLEELVSEFESKYSELGVPLPDFLTGYWESRMREIQEKEEAIFDEEEARKMREVGVVVEGPS